MLVNVAIQEKPPPSPSPGVPGEWERSCTPRRGCAPGRGIARQRGVVPLRVVVILFFIALAAVAWWTYSSTHSDVVDGRETLVFWGNPSLTDEIYTVVHRFEQR